MTLLLAPILTFTAEEVWSAMHSWSGKKKVFIWRNFRWSTKKYLKADLGERWKAMIDAKSELPKL